MRVPTFKGRKGRGPTYMRRERKEGMGGSLVIRGREGRVGDGRERMRDGTEKQGGNCPPQSVGEYKMNVGRQELEKSVSQTTPFRNIKKMMMSKNKQIQQLRARLAAYDINHSPADCTAATYAGRARALSINRRVAAAVTVYHLTHTHTHPFNGPVSGTTRVSRYQKGKTNLDFTEARDSERKWHQLGHMQVCNLLQTDNHANTSPLSFLQAGCPSCRPTNSVKALKAYNIPSKRARNRL